MNRKKILITGITGFIGRHLASFLRRNYPDYLIYGIGRHPSKTYSDYVFYEVDLLQQDKIQAVIEKVLPDYVIHLAGLVFSYDWEALYAQNILGTIHLLEAIKKTNSNTKVLIAGSAAEYGVVPICDLPIKESHIAMPKSPYGMAKLWQNNIGGYYSDTHFSVVNARIFNLIAEDTSPHLSTGDLFTQIQGIMQHKQEARICVGNLDIKRDFLDVDDVCSGLLALVQKGQSGSTYNLCSGVSTSLRDILDLSLRLSGLSIEIVIDKNKLQNTYVKDIYGSNEKIKKETGWQHVVTLESSLKKVFL